MQCPICCAASPAGPDTVAPPKFNSSGLLRQEIEAGAAFDMLASADMEQPRRLQVGHPERLVINFARNRLCAIARTATGITAANMLDRLLDPGVRLGTSTPGADPGGDYAWQVFARAESLHPGAKTALESKALKLVGGGDKTPLLVAGKGAVEGVFLADRADVMLGYCSGAPDVARLVPGLSVVPLPAELTVGPAYGMIVLDAKPVATRFALFVMSQAGQAVLQAYGFEPVASASPAPDLHGLLVGRAGQPSRSLSADQVAAIKPLTQRVGFGNQQADPQTEWGGPLLWDVLAASGAVDPAAHAEQVRQMVRVTGADGYSVLLAMAELSPEFAGRPVQLATALDGKPLAGGAYRLIVPGEHRAGRSVRDVVRIDVE